MSITLLQAQTGGKLGFAKAVSKSDMQIKQRYRIHPSKSIQKIKKIKEIQQQKLTKNQSELLPEKLHTLDQELGKGCSTKPTPQIAANMT